MMLKKRKLVLRIPSKWVFRLVIENFRYYLIMSSSWAQHMVWKMIIKFRQLYLFLFCKTRYKRVTFPSSKTRVNIYVCCSWSKLIKRSLGSIKHVTSEDILSLQAHFSQSKQLDLEPAMLLHYNETQNDTVTVSHPLLIFHASKNHVRSRKDSTNYLPQVVKRMVSAPTNNFAHN